MEIYQRFLNYIDLSTKHAKGAHPKIPFGTGPTILFFLQKSSILQE